MDFFRTVLHYAQVAWSVIAGIPSDVGNALSAVYKFIGAEHALWSRLFAVIGRALHAAHIDLASELLAAIGSLTLALLRVKGWIWHMFIAPVRSFLLGRIAALQRWTKGQLNLVYLRMLSLYFLALSYTDKRVSAERKDRIADVTAARAYALKLVKAAVSAIETEAQAGYRSGNSARMNTVTRITDDLVNRNPALRSIVSDLITALLDLLGTENPLLRAAVQFLLGQVISRLGVDRVTGELLRTLLGPVLGDPRPGNLHDVIEDLSKRTCALEDQWAKYYADGGAELHQAGGDYKSYASLAVNAALLGLFAGAVADPAGWATAVASTVGATVNGAAADVAAIIRKA